MLQENVQARHAFGTWSEFGFDTKNAVALEMFDLIKNDSDREDLIEMFKAGLELEEKAKEIEPTDKKKASKLYVRAVDDYITISIKYLGGGKRGAAMIPIAAGVGAITFAALSTLTEFLVYKTINKMAVDEANANKNDPQAGTYVVPSDKEFLKGVLGNSNLRLGGVAIGVSLGSYAGREMKKRKIAKDLVELATHMKYCVYKVRELRVPEDLERLNKLIRENVNSGLLSNVALATVSSNKAQMASRYSSTASTVTTAVSDTAASAL
jgi:hypothetical protein